MLIAAAVLLFSTALLETKPAPVFADVSIGSAGPYRFLVDTGSQTSLLDPSLAERLRLKPEFRVEIITQNSSRLLPAMKLKTLHIGDIPLGETEVVFHDLTQARRMDASVQGVLGVNALAQLNFLLSPARGRLEMSTAKPSGQSIPFSKIEDRIAVKARMGHEELTLILDSGATHVVLFRTPEAMAKTRAVPVTFGTIEGARSSVPACWTADMIFAKSVKVGMLPAAIVTRPGTQVDGLLPVSVFKGVFVDQARGEVTLVR